MNRVVSEEVHEVVDIHEGVVDSHNLGLASVLGHGSAASESADSTEAVDSESNLGHGVSEVFLCVGFLILITSNCDVLTRFGRFTLFVFKGIPNHLTKKSHTLNTPNLPY